MATLKDIQIHRNWGKRPTGNVTIMGDVYYGVEEGDPYDLVQFSINEIKGYYWNESLCVAVDTSEEEIRKIVLEYISNISNKDIQEYQKFLDWGNKYGWD